MKRSVPGVRAKMHDKLAGIPTPIITDLATEGSFIVMDTEVFLEAASVDATVVTDLTAEWFVTCVYA